MPVSDSFLTPPQMVDELIAGLAEVQAMGFDWRKGRFGSYLEVYQQTLDFPPGAPLFTANGDKRLNLYVEALSQCRQLLDVLPLLRRCASARRDEDLSLILDGTPLPPEDPEKQDRPRNTLFELAAGAALQRYGFTVMLPAVGDLQIGHSSIPTLVTECKRPASGDAIFRNLKKARRQIRERRKAADYGLAIVGIDRLTGLSGKLPGAHDDAHLDKTVQATLKGVWAEIERQERLTSEKLFPHVTIVGLALIGTPVYLLDQKRSVNVSQLNLHSTAPHGHYVSKRLDEEFGRIMTVERAV